MNYYNKEKKQEITDRSFHLYGNQSGTREQETRKENFYFSQEKSCTHKNGTSC